jgi:hypothetical protein
MRRRRRIRSPFLADDQIRLVYVAANSLPPDKQNRFLLLCSCRLQLAGVGGHPISNADLQTTIHKALAEVVAT